MSKTAKELLKEFSQYLEPSLREFTQEQDGLFDESWLLKYLFIMHRENTEQEQQKLDWIFCSIAMSEEDFASATTALEYGSKPKESKYHFRGENPLLVAARAGQIEAIRI